MDLMLQYQGDCVKQAVQMRIKDSYKTAMGVPVSKINIHCGAQSWSKLFRITLLHKILDGLYFTAMNVTTILIKVLSWKIVTKIHDHYINDMDWTSP